MKKALSLILALTMMLCLFAGCTPANTGSTGNNETNPSGEEKPLAGTYDIKVWVAEAHIELITAQIKKFNDTNDQGIKFNATMEACGENDAATKVTADIEAAPDLYTLAQDQVARLIEANALAELGTKATETVKAANSAGVVSAAMAGDKLFAYPMTSDNGYFMYYDKSVVKEESIDSLEKILEDCKAAGKNFSMALTTDAWFAASFFFGAGCHSTWATNEEGKFDTINDNFNSAQGIVAAKGMQILLNSGVHSDTASGEDFSAAVPSAVVVTGTWNYEVISGILGDNMGIADLPSFTVDGKDYHMGSFSGCKLMGVKPQEDAKKQAALHQLAQYLTGEEAQLERFNELKWGPSNLKAMESDAVKANPALIALGQQAAYAVPQGQIASGWWDTTKALAAAIKEAKDEAAIQAALDVYKAAIELMANPATQLDPEQWTVIGIGGAWGDGDDKLMTKQEDGTWKSNEAFELKAGDQFKCRKGGQWAEQVGAGTGDPSNDDNYQVAEDGTYYVVLDVENRKITLVKA